MNGTKSSNDGYRRITRPRPRWNLRLLLFAIFVALVMLVIAWIQTGVGREMAALHREFSEVQAEDLFIGVQARVNVRRLNDLLLDFQLNRNENTRSKFLDEAKDFKEWLRVREADLDTAGEIKLFRQVKETYDNYLVLTKPLLQDSGGTSGPPSFNIAYQTVQQKTLPLLNLIEEFINTQMSAFGVLLQTTQSDLLALRRLLLLSLLLLLASTITLVALVYRGMIAPLRRVLTQSQEVIERQEKLASLGTLAAGVAHEIRNPLTALKLRLFTLKGTLPQEFVANEDLVVVSSELDRLEHIVKDFLQFARPSEPDLARLPAQRLLQEVHDLLARQLEENGIMLNLAPSAPLWVNADHQQIKQAIINLVQNAAESIQRNGAITLRVDTRAERLDGRHNQAVILSVTDTGPGIPPEIEKRLFDPFFTTKEGGTGLGLAIAARIVSVHGGILRYQTKLNHGTTFEIVLPQDYEHASATVAH